MILIIFLFSILIPSSCGWLAPGDKDILNHISSRLNLPPTEKLQEDLDHVGIPTNLQPFFGSQSFELNKVRLWQNDWPEGLPNFVEWYAQTLLAIDVPSPFASCWMQAYNMLTKWNESAIIWDTPHKWNASATAQDWESLYWNNSLSGTGFSFKWNHTREDNTTCNHIQDSFAVDTLMRIDVWPDDWFNAGYLATVRNVPLASATVCAGGTDQTIEQCFLDPKTGVFNGITTGVVIATGISRNSTWTKCGQNRSYLNSTSTSKLAQPYILGYIIREIPWEGANCFSNSSRPPVSPPNPPTDTSSGDHPDHPHERHLLSSPYFFAGCVVGALVVGGLAGAFIMAKVGKHRRMKNHEEENQLLIQDERD